MIEPVISRAKLRQNNKLGEPESPPKLELSSQSEFLDQTAIPFMVLAAHVLQQAAALSDHHQKSASAVKILGMRPQMLGQLVDAISEHRHLHFRRASVFGVRLVRFYDFFFPIYCKYHLLLIPFSFIP